MLYTEKAKLSFTEDFLAGFVPFSLENQYDIILNFNQQDNELSKAASTTIEEVGNGNSTIKLSHDFCDAARQIIDSEKICFLFTDQEETKQIIAHLLLTYTNKFPTSKSFFVITKLRSKGHFSVSCYFLQAKDLFSGAVSEFSQQVAEFIL